MGKGDKRTKRGKITVGSYGNSRPKTKKAPVVKGGKGKKLPPKKTPAKRS